MVHLGLNLYCWGDAQQRRLLAECLDPLVRELRERQLVRRFFWTHFDARGPHLFAVFTTTAERRQALAAAVSAQLEAFLKAHPSADRLEEEELQRRHEQCRGKALCLQDRLPGFAANNSFVLFDHAPDAYPFRLSHGREHGDGIWNWLDGVTAWALGQVGRGTATVASLRWLAAIDRGLWRAGLDGEAYWRYHATTLLLPLAARLETAEEEVLASLPKAVGERNHALFARLWSSDSDAGDADLPNELEPPINWLVDQAATLEEQRWSLLREIDHLILMQLGQPVRLHIPMVLFAWLQNLSARAAA